MSTTSHPVVVRRSDVPSIHTVVEGGREHVLGTLKEFIRNEELWNFMPKDSRIAMAWVHLDRSQTLDEHIHPVGSMILVCQGNVEVFGDVQGELIEGDILLVPSGSRHGLTGSGTDGFWGISMQFNSRGLYENLEDPLATFVDESTPFPYREETQGSVLEALLARNERYAKRFSSHRLFTMAERGLLQDENAQQRFLDCFQIWSNYFQKMVQARSLFSSHPRFAALAQAHLSEEFGHNIALQESRTTPRAVWDPVLESTCAWFPWQIMSLGELEQVVLVHLVVEVSATIFYQQMTPYLTEALDHFRQHAKQDDYHVEMGVEFLRQCQLGEGTSLFEVQARGWEMLNAMFGRIADLSLR